MAEPNPLPMSPWQEEAAMIPDAYNLALLAAKGGGKTYLFVIFVIMFVVKYGPKFRGLFIRWDHAGGSDVMALCQDLFTKAFGARGFRANTQSGVFTFHNGARFEVNQCADLGDANKFAGRSITHLFVDEIQQWPEDTVFRRLQANLRSDANLPLRVMVAGNPGGIGQSWLLRTFFRAGPWEPFDDEAGRTWVRVPSTFKQNIFIPHDQVDRQLAAAYAGDAGMLAALRDGNWYACQAGTSFGDVIDENRNAVATWPSLPMWQGERWEEVYLAHDFGSSAPSYTAIVAKSPGAEAFGQWYPRDSLIVIDELATNEPGSLTKGMGYTVPILAEMIREMCDHWGIRPEGVADDSIFAKTGSGAGSISDEFRAAGVFFCPAKKGSRVYGWGVLRKLLQNAGTDLPAMYIARHCEYAWQTLPYLARDPRRPEDVDSRGPDHAGDCLRYAALRERRIAVMEDMFP